MTHDTRDGLQDHDVLERARRARVDAEVTAAAGVTRAREREDGSVMPSPLLDMSAPLRKIVGYDPVVTYANGMPHTSYMERLECGHLVGSRVDILGAETTATRRRCKKCGATRGPR